VSLSLPVLKPILQPGPVTLRTVWECCSWPSPCFGGCDGGSTTTAHACATCGQWTKASPETLRHHHMCPVVNWSLAEYGPARIDADGRPEMGAPEVIGGDHG
jgi:hypothetical protein